MLQSDVNGKLFSGFGFVMCTAQQQLLISHTYVSLVKSSTFSRHAAALQKQLLSNELAPLFSNVATQLPNLG